MSTPSPEPKLSTPNPNDIPSPNPSAEAGDSGDTDTKQGTKPSSSGDPNKLRELKDASDFGKSAKTKEESSDGFGLTSTFDRMKDKASEVGDAVKKRARRVQNRSAEHDAQRAREATERVTNEVGNTLMSLVKSGVSLLVGGTYGTISGVAKSAMPTHAQTIRASDDLRLAGQWFELHQGASYKDKTVDYFEVQFNEGAAEVLGCSSERDDFIVNKEAVETTMVDPSGDRVTVISSPIYHPENDRMVGVLAFVNEGDYGGHILMHMVD